MDDDRSPIEREPTTVPWVGGRVLAGRYRLEAPVGEGAMGVVWRARDQELQDRVVAIKALPEVLRRDLRGLRQLRQEAETAIGLNHPHIAGVNHLELRDGGVFLVMEYVDGPTLARRLAERGVLSPEDVIAMAEPLCDALAYAHGQGAIHRDIKPGNILLGARGPKLADFGIAVSVRETMHRLSRVPTEGTLPYMAPEQIRGQTVPTERTDVYQLAATLYECLAGDPPLPPRRHRVPDPP